MYFIRILQQYTKNEPSLKFWDKVLNCYLSNSYNGIIKKDEDTRILLFDNGGKRRSKLCNGYF